MVVDREHGAIDLKDTENLIRAGHSTDISVLVRVPSCEPAAISQPLDMGAAGIHVPQIETAEMAELAVNSSKYHPLGDRGLQPYVQSASYGARGAANYLAAANHDPLIVLQVEGKQGVANLDAILNVEGIDVAFIGPYDLSQSLGFPGQLRHPFRWPSDRRRRPKGPKSTASTSAPIVTTWTQPPNIEKWADVLPNRQYRRLHFPFRRAFYCFPLEE